MNVNNLIDLTNGDEHAAADISSMNPDRISIAVAEKLNVNSENNTLTEKKTLMNCPDIGGDVLNTFEIESNNPFDEVERNARLFDDPFEIGARAETIRKFISVLNDNETRTENLLQIAEGDPDLNFFQNICKDFPERSSVGYESALDSNKEFFKNKNNNNDVQQQHEITGNINIKDTLTLDLDGINTNLPKSLNFHVGGKMTEPRLHETSTMLLNKSFPNNIVQHQKLTKNCKGDLRNFLLKRTISNSSSSPQSIDFQDPKIGESDSSANPTIFKNGKFVTEKATEVESPMSSPSQSSYEDIWAIEPKWIESETDSDLEMMKIPFLDKLETEPPNAKLDVDSTTLSSIDNLTDPNDNKMMNFSQLKDKFQTLKINKYHHDINTLIDELKNLVFKCQDNDKKSQAHLLLESLRSLFAISNINDEQKNSNDLIDKRPKRCHNEMQSTETTPNPVNEPIPLVVRQGTFDLDIPENKNLPDADDDRTRSNSEYYNAQDDISETTQYNNNSKMAFGVNSPCKNVAKFGEHSEVNTVKKPSLRRRAQSFTLHDKNNQQYRQQDKIVLSSVVEPKTLVNPKYVRRSNSTSNTPLKIGPALKITNSKRISSIQTPVKPMLLLTKTLQRRTISSSISRNSYEKATASSPKTKLQLNVKKLIFKPNEPKCRVNGPLKATIPIPRMGEPLASAFSGETAENRISDAPISTERSITYANACSTPISTSVASKECNLLFAPRCSKINFRSPLLPKSNLSAAFMEPDRRKSYTGLPSPNIRFCSTKLQHQEITGTSQINKNGASTYRLPNSAFTLKPFSNKENNQP